MSFSTDRRAIPPSGESQPSEPYSAHPILQQLDLPELVRLRDEVCMSIDRSHRSLDQIEGAILDAQSRAKCATEPTETPGRIELRA